jgi:TonB family protein
MEGFLKFLFALVLFVAFFAANSDSALAQAQPEGDTKLQIQQPPADVQELANRLASDIPKSKRGKVLVLDFRGPDSAWVPFSAWLADEFSAALGNSGKPLEVVPRSQLTAAMADRHLKPNDTFDAQTSQALVESLGAQVIVSGSFAGLQNGVGITMTYSTKQGQSWVAQPFENHLRGKIALPSEVSTLLGITLDSLRPKEGVYQTDGGGVSYPSCLDCPHPEYSRAAIDGKVQGTVVMLVTISADGRATQIEITKKLCCGLDEEAIDAVKHWKFKPATGVDGIPVPVRAPIVVSFRLGQ